MDVPRVIVIVEARTSTRTEMTTEDFGEWGFSKLDSYEDVTGPYTKPVCDHIWKWIKPSGTNNSAHLCLTCGAPDPKWLDKIEEIQIGEDVCYSDENTPLKVREMLFKSFGLKDTKRILEMFKNENILFREPRKK